MKRPKRFKKQKHLIAHWFKRLEFRRNRKPKPPKPPENWMERVRARLRGEVE